MEGQIQSEAVCFVTGVPGAGKTLVGLDAATRHLSSRDELYSVFLSGNGPLVKVLQEALARDHVRLARLRNQPVRKGDALRRVQAFIQNVHHFRDDCLKDPRPPVEHVAIFDEAQRAWTLKQTVDFMRRKKRIAGFSQSEPEFLLSCLDRHRDWAAVVCLVGGGQEINTGEAGIREWLSAVTRSFPSWRVYVSDQLTDSEYAAGPEIAALAGRQAVEVKRDLHLATSVRSFRSEKVSRLVKEVLDLETAAARETLRSIGAHYPLVLTRDLGAARAWLRRKARGSERYGIVVSSQAERLKPHAVDVRTPVNPVHWFLNGKDDVRSSYYLEDVATEFQVQGLELDWACVVWDADFRYQENHRDTEARRLRHLDVPPSPRGGVVGDLEESLPATLREEDHREEPFGGSPSFAPGGGAKEGKPPAPLGGTWEHWSFKGKGWERIRSAERQAYLKNAYRVLLTRARQGMVIVVPEGDGEDQTRRPGYYDGTYEYLKRMGMGEI